MSWIALCFILKTEHLKAIAIRVEAPWFRARNLRKANAENLREQIRLKCLDWIRRRCRISNKNKMLNMPY